VQLVMKILLLTRYNTQESNFLISRDGTIFGLEEYNSCS